MPGRYTSRGGTSDAVNVLREISTVRKTQGLLSSSTALRTGL